MTLSKQETVIRELSQDEHEAEKFIALAEGYVATFREWFKGAKLISVEEHLERPLPGGFTLHGYIDKLVEHPETGLTLLDHKTTTEDINNPNSRYWGRLLCDPQSTCYALLCKLAGYELDTMVWDVVRKPTIKPKKILKRDLKVLRESRWYYGHQITDDLDFDNLSYETPHLYGCRVAEWISANTPYHRHLMVRPYDVVHAYQDNLKELGELLNSAFTAGAFPQNHLSCYAFNRPCDYFGPCHYGQPIESEEFTHKDGDWRRLSHSSISAWFTCPRKFFWSSVVRQVPTHQDSEALRQGGLWHTIMDVVYANLLKGESNAS